MLDKVYLTKDIQIHLDIQEYLESNYEWEHEKWNEERLIAASPFREDNHPSFFVNYNNEFAGTWGDSGSGESGNFIDLVARLNDTDYDTALEMLKEEFWVKPYEAPPLGVGISIPKPRDSFEIPEHNVSKYLLGRGITEKVQEAYRTSEKDGSIVLPYLNGMGVCQALKFRRTDTKDFYYVSGNNHIKNMLFGMHLVYELSPSTIVICEAEIDAMTAYSWGYVGVSLGAANLIDNQVELIKKLGVKNIIIGTDNDKKGKETAWDIRKAFDKTHTIFKWNLPEGYDLNQFLTTQQRKPQILKISEPKLVSKKLWYIQ